MQILKQTNSLWAIMVAVGVTLCIVCMLGQLVQAGGNKGKGKGGNEDIILYNGNIVLRGGGDKKGGSGNIVLANHHPHHEEVEYSPNYFGGYHGGHHGGGGYGGGGFGGFGEMGRR